jgi:hypothetical protein
MMTTMQRLMAAAALLGALTLPSAKASLILEGYYATNRPANSNPQTELEWAANELGIPEEDLIFFGKVEDEGDNVTEDPLDLFANGNIIVTEYEGDDKDAYVAWDLTGTPYEMTAVFVKGGSNTGDSLYSVTPDQFIASGSPQFVTLNPEIRQGGISHISFFGTMDGETPPPTTQVPDGGATVFMLGGMLVGLRALRLRRNI